MHLSSLKNMEKFVDNFLAGKKNSQLKILDLGSTEMGACYKPIFNSPGWTYIGADLQAGPNVNLVLSKPYHWQEIETGSIDVLISGQVLEHVEFFWITLLEISRVLKPGGLVCVVVPSTGPEHRYPVDCWRFYPDSMHAMARFARLECVMAQTAWENVGDPGSDFWHDTVGIFKKPERGFFKNLGVQLLQDIQRRSMSYQLV